MYEVLEFDTSALLGACFAESDKNATRYFN